MIQVAYRERVRPDRRLPRHLVRIWISDLGRAMRPSRSPRVSYLSIAPGLRRGRVVVAAGDRCVVVLITAVNASGSRVGGRARSWSRWRSSCCPLLAVMVIVVILGVGGQHSQPLAPAPLDVRRRRCRRRADPVRDDSGSNATAPVEQGPRPGAHHPAARSLVGTTFVALLYLLVEQPHSAAASGRRHRRIARRHLPTPSRSQLGPRARDFAAVAIRRDQRIWRAQRPDPGDRRAWLFAGAARRSARHGSARRRPSMPVVAQLVGCGPDRSSWSSPTSSRAYRGSVHLRHPACRPPRCWSSIGVGALAAWKLRRELGRARSSTVVGAVFVAVAPFTARARKRALWGLVLLAIGYAAFGW